MVTAAGVALVNRIPVLLLPGDVFACRNRIRFSSRWSNGRLHGHGKRRFSRRLAVLGQDQQAGTAHGRMHQRHAGAD